MVCTTYPFIEAVALFQEMQSRNVNGDRFIVVALLTGCAQLGALVQGEWIHGSIEENIIKIDIETLANAGA